MTAEQQALLQKARDSLRAGELLCDQELFDFSASRTYYAMFYLAQAILLERGLSFSKHAAVIASFGREFARAGEVPVQLHRYLIEAQDQRNVGDYGIGPGVGEEAAREQLRRGREFLATADAFLASHAPDRDAGATAGDGDMDDETEDDGGRKRGST